MTIGGARFGDTPGYTLQARFSNISGLQTGAIVFNGAMVTMLPAFYCGASYYLHRQFDAAETVAAIERELKSPAPAAKR